ncbi:hypothetical protein PFISCL1PPCAC_3177, partial [Pristionchus fissidentatus]
LHFPHSTRPFVSIMSVDITGQLDNLKIDAELDRETTQCEAAAQLENVKIEAKMDKEDHLSALPDDCIFEVFSFLDRDTLDRM